MDKYTTFSCYIEEYNLDGKLCARLRDKNTEKIVSFLGTAEDKTHLLQFLSQAKIYQNMMPTIYDRNGDDIVVVKGNVISTTAEEITHDYKTGEYWFD